MYTVYKGITFGIRHLGQVSRAIISTLLTKMPHFLDMLFSAAVMYHCPSTVRLMHRCRKTDSKSITMQSLEETQRGYTTPAAWLQLCREGKDKREGNAYAQAALHSSALNMCKDT